MERSLDRSLVIDDDVAEEDDVLCAQLGQVRRPDGRGAEVLFQAGDDVGGGPGP